MSERYESRKAEIKKEFSNPQSDYYTKDKEVELTLMGDELEYQVKNVYKLPEEATWTHKKCY